MLFNFRISFSKNDYVPMGKMVYLGTFIIFNV